MPQRRARVEEILTRIEQETHPAFLAVDAARARADADAADARRRDGTQIGPLDGMITPVKDLFDVAGERTGAGAALRADAPLARADAAVVARLRAAGAILLGRTHMNEFAFSGLGLNPHYPTLSNALDPSRIPGGSSSGAAVAVADGLADIAIGTDTGGSCRIPAALNGIVGMKPSWGLISTEGCFPLAPSLDTVGPLGPDVAACASAFHVLSGVEPATEPSGALRLAVMGGRFRADLDPDVATAYEAALRRIEAAGAEFVELDADAEWDAMLGAFPAPLVCIEAAAAHLDEMTSRRAAFDPRVASRIALGLDAPATGYLRGIWTRRSLVAAFAERIATVDAILYPTVPIQAPQIAPLATDDDAFFRANGLMLRNPSFANLFDLCALSLPLRLSDAASAGLTIACPHGSDARLLAIAAALEPTVAG